MNCNEILDILSEYIDGDLETDRSEQVKAHLASCADCHEEEAALRRLVGAAVVMPHEIEPSRDLWPGIEKRIAQPGKGEPERTPASFPGRKMMPVWTAMAASLLTAALVMIAFRSITPESGVTPMADGGGTVPTAVPAAVLDTYDDVEASFKSTRDSLLAELETRKDQMDPATVATVMNNLKIMEEAAREIRLALGKDPGNQGLRGMLVASYQGQVNLLKQANEIPLGM